MTCDFTLAATSIGSTRLTRMIREDVHQEFVAALLEQVDHGVVQGVLVLLQPTGDIVGYLNSLSQIDYINSMRSYVAGVMADGEVSSLLARLWWFGLQEVGRFAQVVGVQFLLKGLVSGLGEHRLFFKDGQDAHRLFKHKFRLEEVVVLGKFLNHFTIPGGAGANSS